MSTDLGSGPPAPANPPTPDEKRAMNIDDAWAEADERQMDRVIQTTGSVAGSLTPQAPNPPA